MSTRPLLQYRTLNGIPNMNYLNLRGLLFVVSAVLALASTGCSKGTSVASEASGKTAVTARAAAKNEPESDGGKTAAPNSKTGAEKEEAEKNEQNLVMSAEEIATTGIKTAELTAQEVSQQITMTANIQANQDRLAQVMPRVPGRVVRVTANLGDQVKAGQVLATIDSIEVGEAQSSYVQAVSEHALAKAGMARADKLYAEQIIPQKDYLRTRADYEKAKAVLRAADDKRTALGVSGRRQGASGGNSTFTLVSPLAGTVIEKKAVVGELAQPDHALFAVADLSQVWIVTNLYEKDFSKVKTGAPATVTVAAYPSEIFKGKVTYISNVMDKESRTAKARVEVPNTDGRLKVDMFANASITTAGGNKSLVLPEEAVVLIQGQPTAFVQEKSGFEARPAELGEKLRGRVVLKSGIKAGEMVVVSGAYALKAKMLKSQISAE